METDFTEQARDAVCRLFGEAVYQLVAEGQPVTNESLADIVVKLSEGEPDLAEDFASQLLLHKGRARHDSQASFAEETSSQNNVRYMSCLNMSDFKAFIASALSHMPPTILS